MIPSRAQLIENGELISFSDVAKNIGYAWELCMTSEVEDMLIKTLPKDLLHSTEQLVQDAASLVLMYIHQKIMELDPETSQHVHRLDIQVPCSWRSEEEFFPLTLVFGPDDDGKPVLTLYSTSELNV